MNLGASKRRARKRSGQGITVVVALFAFLLIAGGVVSYFMFRNEREKPEFPSLQEAPDKTLVGTVAYVEAKTNCIRLIALSGTASRQLYCIPAWSAEEAKKLGKPLPPQLVWLADGKLEVTFFRMTDPPGINVVKGWQYVIDAVTGQLVNTPTAEVPSSPNLATHLTKNVMGEIVKFSSDAESGRVKVWVESPNGSMNTVIDERGPGKYTYGMNAAFWGPDNKTIFAEDGRILVITPEADLTVRVLVEEGEFGFEADDPARSAFAVTTADYLQ